MNAKQQLGNQGEQAVATYLINQGFTILAKNFRIRDGEIDIIAQKKELALFVEVKTRHNPLIDPAEVIPRSKQKKIIHTTYIFCAQHNLDLNTVTCRFDVALVSFDNNKPLIIYIPDAFQAGEYA